jgi:hypothetical protein
VKPHGRPTAVTADDRLAANPAQLAEALERLPRRRAVSLASTEMSGVPDKTDKTLPSARTPSSSR